MSYLALYRKYRPASFEEVAGQTAVVTALRNQVKYGQIGHAYLFCGTRGTGKTSMAKIFAKAVNCLNPQDGSPCNECEMCREAQSGFNMIEIDAASNNGVENIRELRDEVVYTPVKGRYKVYIIDEVHMLSSQAFNALLKTLEEPPEHVIFVLATTEPHKVMSTILSRCQRYDFKRLTVEEITARLQLVAGEEGIDAEQEALAFIAATADGGMRDALSMLDQCYAYYMKETITLPKVLDVLGAVDNQVLGRMTRALVQADAGEILGGIEEIYQQGRDPQQFVTAWNGYLRGVLLHQVMKEKAAEYVVERPQVLAVMAEQAKEMSPDQVTFFIQELSKLANQLKYASQKRILLESQLLSLTRGNGVSADLGLLARIEQLEQKIRQLEENGVKVSGRNVNPVEVKEEKVASAPKETAASKPMQNTGGTGEGLAKDWLTLRKSIIKENGALYILNFMTLSPGEGPDEWVLRTDKEIYRQQLEMGGGEKLRLIEDKIAQATGQKVKLSTGATQTSAVPSMEELLSGIKTDINWH